MDVHLTAEFNRSGEVLKLHFLKLIKTKLTWKKKAKEKTNIIIVDNR